MPTPLHNQASITYSYSGATTPEVASSNVTSTTLLDEYSLKAAKSVLSKTFRPGENITYLIELENNGRGILYNVVVNDNLGGSAHPLRYLPNTARLFINGVLTSVTPVLTSDTLQFVLPNSFAPGDVALLIYVAVVSASLPASTDLIQNTLSVSANGGSSSGTLVTSTPANPYAAIYRESYASVSIYKQSDKPNVVAGETLTYTFTLTNTGNQEATGVILNDMLPGGFVPTLVTASTGGSTTVYSPDDYQFDIATNTITMPNASGAPITVPAASNAGPGLTSIVITGTIASA